MRSIPEPEFPPGFLLSANESHWSKEEETLKLLDTVVAPYLAKTKEELAVDSSQKSCNIWDAFSAQQTPSVKEKLTLLDIKDVGVPKNMTHLQPLHLTTNDATKKTRSASLVRISCLVL